MSSTTGKPTTPVKRKSSSEKEDPALFKGVRFFLNDSLPISIRDALAKIMTARGGTACNTGNDEEVLDEASSSASPPRRFDVKDCTHVITDTLDFPEYSALRPEGEGTPGEPEDESLVKIVTLPESDTLALQAGVKSLGGQWRRELTKDVTHLFVVAPSGNKYAAAIRYGPTLGMVVVLPHWFEECLKLHQLLPIDLYQFPLPPLSELQNSTDSSKSYEERLIEYRAAHPNGRQPKPAPTTLTATILGDNYATEKQSLDTYRRTAVVQCQKADPTILPRSNGPTNALIAADSTASSTLRQQSKPTTTKAWPAAMEVPKCGIQIFSERSVYLASDLCLRPGLEVALKKRIEEAGGACWSWGVDGAEKAAGMGEADQWDRRRRAEKALKEANTVVIRTREGWEYWLAYEQDKTIGNLAWMYHVLAASKLDSPLDRLLHYPLPAGLIPGFDKLNITVSNYNGLGRDYVRTLIESCGGKFDGEMTKNTSYVVTASSLGKKYQFAQQWSIPCVTHLWLEACLLEWKFVQPTSSSLYSVSAATPENNFAGIVGKSPLPRAAVTKWAEKSAVKEERKVALMPWEPQMDLDIEEAGLKEVEMDGVEEVAGNEGEKDVEMEEVETGVSRDTGKGAGTEVDQAGGDDDEDDQDDEDVQTLLQKAPTPTKSKGKEREKEKVNEVSKPARPSSKSDKSPSKPARNEPIVTKIDIDSADAEEDDDDEDSEEEEEAKVVIPPRKSAKDDPKEKSKETPSAKKAAPRKPIPAPVPLVTNKPSPSSSANPASSARPPKASSATKKPLHNDDDDEDESDDNVNVNAAAVAVAPRKGRAAASAANAKLGVQMKDAIKFAQEQKGSAKKRKRDSLSHPVSSDRGGARGGHSSEEEEAEDKPAQKKSTSKKSVVARSGAAEPVVSQDGVLSSFDNPPHPPKKPRDPSQKLPKILTTGLNIDKDGPELRKLFKLGVKWTDKPSEVTHLVANKIARTENFLNCIPYAPLMVTQAWIMESIKAGELVDETPYLLQDKEKEKALGTTLPSILARAKAGKLFDGYTIYITKKVKPEYGLCTRVTQHSGGIASAAKLSGIRDLAKREKIFVVSCAEDRKEWENLASKGVPIFSVEALFESALKQQFCFTDGYRVDLQLNR